MRRGSAVSDTHPSGTSVLSIFPFIQFDANKRACKAVQIQADHFPSRAGRGCNPDKLPSISWQIIECAYAHSYSTLISHSSLNPNLRDGCRSIASYSPIHEGLLLASSFHGKRLLTISSPSSFQRHISISLSCISGPDSPQK